MAITAADWKFTRNASGGGEFDYIGDDHVRFGGTTPSYASVIEFHRWASGLADDPEYSGDDEIDIINLMPTTRATDNIISLTAGITITDTAIEHLYDGTILQTSDGTRWDGIVNYGNSDVYIQLIQNGAVLTDDFWNLTGGGGINADATNGISHRFLVKTIDAGTDVDSRKLIGTCRTYGKTYSEFKINGASAGNNVLALSDTNDLNNGTASGTVATWDQFANDNEGYFSQDVNGDTTNENYYSNWDIGGGSTPASPTINDLYEYAKYLTRDGSASTLYGLSGELFRGITHEISGTQASGTFVEPESLSWTGGTGQLLAIDSTTAGTKLYIQLLTGSAPTSGTVTGNGGATFTASGATERPISTPFIGASTGSAIIGAYGINVDKADLTAADTLFDLTNTAVYPPNQVSFTVGGVVSGEDYVFVGPWDGTTTDADGNPEVDYNQLTHSTLLSSATTTAITVDSAIPTDTPESGTIRVQTDSGFYQLVEYTSYSGSTFTITSEDFSGDNSDGTGTPKNVFISYIDTLAGATSESFTSVYLADRNLVVKVRDGGASPIKEYITGSSLGNNGGGVTAIRTVDA